MGRMEDILGKIKKIRRDQWIVLLLAGILVVVVTLPSQDAEKEGAQAQTETESIRLPESTDMEDRLEDVLSRLEGAGEVRVMITYGDGGEKIVEKDTPSILRTNGGGESGGTAEEQHDESTVYERDGNGRETPYVTREISPQVEGVLVLAQGGDSAVVKKEITDAVMALFDLEAHKIKVMKMQERRG